MVQFRPETGEDGYALEGNEKMIHTGMASVRLSSSIGKMPKFTQEPLGAALRVSPFDQAAKQYQPGDEFNAFVYSYHVQGDNESPLLVLSVDNYLWKLHARIQTEKCQWSRDLGGGRQHQI